MIHKPNVRARCLQSNLQARHPGNRQFVPRSYRIYCRPCRWCKRPKTAGHWAYPGLCVKCTGYLLQVEASDLLYEWIETRQEHEMRNSSLLRTGFGHYMSRGRHD